MAALDEADLSLIFQEAAERSYRERLAPRIAAHAAVEPLRAPDALLVFCIDVRSELFRRALEAEGRYITAGYAGFFGLPVAFRDADGRRVRQLPVVVEPQHDLALAPPPGRDAARADAAARLFGFTKAGAATGFATAELTGPLAGALMLANTLAPGLADTLRRRWSGERHADAPAVDALSLAERLAYARALFQLTGVRAADTRLLLLAGHGGQTVNNPYASALDCGACGGHRGGGNARALAAILNQAEVRGPLIAEGLIGRRHAGGRSRARHHHRHGDDLRPTCRPRQSLRRAG